jgi:putative MATE family efflux protein
MEQRKKNKLGIMPVGRLTVTMAWPAMLSMFIHSLYSIVDSIFVATISENALIAVTLAFPIQILIIALAVGTGVGVNSLISRRLGAQRYQEADAAASHGLRLALLNWTVFGLFSLVFAALYIQAYSDTSFIVEQGTQYLQIITFFSLFVFLQVNTEKVLQATGNMIFPMLCMMTGAILNIIFDALLIFGLAGFPALGVLGAAVATIIGQFVSMILGFFLLFAFKHDVQVKIRHFQWQWSVVKDIYVVGFPSIIMQAISSVMLFLINGILAGYSETAMAVVGAYFRLQSFVFMPVFGLTQGSMPIMGYNYGAKNKERLMQSYFFGFRMALIITMLGTTLFMVFPKELLLLFSATPAMLEIGIPALRIISITFIPASFGIITSTLFQATAHGMLSLWQSLIRQLIGIVPLAYFLVYRYGVPGIWWSWPLAEILSVLFTLYFLHRVYRLDIQKM